METIKLSVENTDILFLLTGWTLTDCFKVRGALPDLNTNHNQKVIDFMLYNAVCNFRGLPSMDRCFLKGKREWESFTKITTLQNIVENIMLVEMIKIKHDNI